MRVSFFALGCLFPVTGGASSDLKGFLESFEFKTVKSTPASPLGDSNIAIAIAIANSDTNSDININSGANSNLPFEILMNENHNKRRLQLDEDDERSAYTCDVQFMECLDHPKCTSCFKAMQINDIDWSIIAPDEACSDVLDAIILKAGYCKDLGVFGGKDAPERDVFCKTFDSCVIWKDDYSDDDATGDNDDYSDPKKKNKYSIDIDCTSLTKCEWEGMKPRFIGDGICHDFIDGCYNTAICDYDGGDCCPDTCTNSTRAGSDTENGAENLIGPPCGSDGYFCRDPSSANCITCGNDNGKDDPNNPDNKAKPAKINCLAEETSYKLFQYDSFGDGWDRTEMTITNRIDSTQTPLYDGRLETGAQGIEYVCLSSLPACYQVKLFGGFWGNEISWEIKPMKNGAPAMASGGAPMDCEFPVAGAHCDNTCTGRSNIDPAQDEKYHTYHKMANCIGEKCIIQLGMCENDAVCNSCITDTVPAYCLASDLYNALGFCTECNCLDLENDEDNEEKEKFCQQKSREKHDNEDDGSGSGNGGNHPDNPDSDTSKRVRACSFDEFATGSSAVIQYSECSEIDTLSALLTNFDPDNFGMLDAFENCASEYTKSTYGKSALDCMRILDNAVVNPSKGKDSNKDVPVAAISALANDLLHDGENFCECSTKASEAAPVCQDFMHFKTLLYESLDGCRALDAIDCDAWAEFYVPCKANLIDKFKKVDFRKKAQCTYMQDRCGNVGPFPSFRRLDCGEEIGEEAWDFYLDYERNCMRDSPPSPGKPSTPITKAPSKPIPVATSSPTTTRKAKPYSPPSSSGGSVPAPAPKPVPSNSNPDNKKKYVPPEKRGKSGSGESGGHKFRNFVLICILAGGLYWFFKNRYGLFSFDYNQFRRARNYGYDNNTDMYDSLTLQNNQATFEPPTLPPPPSAYEDGANNYSYPMSNMGSGQGGGV